MKEESSYLLRGEQRLVKDESRDLWMGVQMLLNEDAGLVEGSKGL